MTIDLMHSEFMLVEPQDKDNQDMITYSNPSIKYELQTNDAAVSCCGDDITIK